MKEKMSREQAVIDAHDAELEAMEKEVVAKLSSESKVESDEVTEDASKVEETTDTTSADGTKETPKEETVESTKTTDKPDGGKQEEDEDADLTEEEQKQLSAKAQKRYKRMSKTIADLNRENEFFRKSGVKPIQSETKPAERIKFPWETEEETATDEQMTPDEIVEKAREAVRQEMKAEHIISTVKSDTKELETLYPELNPEHESYDRVLVTKIATWYKAQFKDNPDVRLKDFVTEVMSLRSEGVEKGKSEATDILIKQSGTQALRPSAATPASTSIEKKISEAGTIAELEALEKSL